MFADSYAVTWTTFSYIIRVRKRVYHRTPFCSWRFVAVADTSKNGIHRLRFCFWENSLHKFLASSLAVLYKCLASSLQVPCKFLAGFCFLDFFAGSLTLFSKVFASSLMISLHVF